MLPPSPSRARWSSWLFATGAAGAFFLALSGVAVRRLSSVPAERLYIAAAIVLLGFVFGALYGENLKKLSYLASLSVPVFLSLMTQWTGGWASPLSGFPFSLGGDLGMVFRSAARDGRRRVVSISWNLHLNGGICPHSLIGSRGSAHWLYPHRTA
jgi:hypothetical protein